MRNGIFAQLFSALIGSGVLFAGQPAQSEGNLFYILDGSASMWEEFEGRTRIEVAKDLLRDRLPKWQAENINIGLVAYGHRRKGDCEDIGVLVDLGPAHSEAQRTALENAISGLSPKGKTPIAASIDLVADRLRTGEEAAHVILVSDGKENCHPDPCGAVRRLRELGIAFTMDVIGFDVTEEERAQLQCLAEEGGGTYFAATSAPEAIQALVTSEKKAPEALTLLDNPPAQIVKVSQNIQFVVDMSQSMTAPFDGRTKYDTVLSRLGDKLADPVSDLENLSLRSYGGACAGGGDSRLVVPFGTENARKIRTELDRLKLSGQPTLAASIIAAIGDFDDPARYDGVARRIVLFAGSAGACDPMLPQQVRERLDAARIEPVLHLIAMDPPPNHADDLRNMVGASRARLHVVKTQEELDKVLTEILEVEPVVDGINTVVGMLNDVVRHMNSGIQAVNGDNFAGANAEVEAGKRLIYDTNTQFTDLGARASRKTFRDLYEKASENRELQRRALRLVEQLVEAGKADDADQWNSVVENLNNSVGTYNSNISTINSLIQGL